MKGFGLLLVLIALAVGGYLVVKEYQPGSAGGGKKSKSNKKARGAPRAGRQAHHKKEKTGAAGTRGSPENHFSFYSFLIVLFPLVGDLRGQINYPFFPRPAPHPLFF
ncbi:MAG TPA: hypothetical protein QF900_07020, partial [Arenicellales bacterium]|nr:hypothetical protein [Arenicellales bacterium]